MIKRRIRNYLSASTFGSLILALTAPQPLLAGNFNVDPVHITLRGGQSSTPVEVTNFETTPLSLRVSALSWRQDGGDDVHEETKDVIVSPPIFTIPPGGKQVVRIGLRGRQGSAPAYRIIVREIPNADPEPGTVQVALEMNLPLYLIPNDKAQPRLDWTVAQQVDGQVTIEARNSGTRQAQVYRISTVDARGKEVLLSEDVGAVLPGSLRRWSAGKQPALSAGPELALKLKGPDGETEVRAVVAKR